MWRPGAPAPGKKKKKSSSSSSKKPQAANPRSKQPHPASSASKTGGLHGPKASKPKPSPVPAPAERSRPEVDDDGRPGGVLELDSRPVMPGIAQRGEDYAAKPKTELSRGVRGLKFMKRKEDEREAAQAEAARLRKMREDKWVIDPSLLQSTTGKLVCEPLKVAPQNLSGRKSFGSFNRKLEDVQAQSKRMAAQMAKDRVLEEDAIGEDEMADLFATNIQERPRKKTKRQHK